MLSLFYGNDFEKRKIAREREIFDFKKKFSNFEILIITDTKADPFLIESLSFGGGLFDKKFLVLLEYTLENEEFCNFILPKLKILQESNNAFLFLERSLVKENLKNFIKIGAKIEEFSLPKTEKKDNVFLVANAIEQRNKKNAWLLFNKLLKNGVAGEKILGILFWKIKDMIVKKKFRNFSEIELKQLSSKFTQAFHEGHRGGRKIEDGIEKIILESL